MRAKSPWNARLAPVDAAPSDRLVTALAEDIIEGHIEAGARLPAHRDLASQLGIGLGTVTKAYAILERRGLVRSVKGSGMFVSVSQARGGPMIDMSRNVPPALMTERLLARTLAAVAKRVDADLFNSYPPTAGHEEYRRQMARWFAGKGMEADPHCLLLTSGAHHAVSVAVSVACGVGGILCVEEQTYPGAIALARHLGLNLVGVPADSEGIVPDALDRALEAKGNRQTAVFLSPTMNNPTTTTMSLARRRAVVDVCRDHDVTIIEDDVYALVADRNLPPLAMLAPERTLYTNSLSKTLNPALRIGGLVTPKTMYAQAEAALQVSALMVSSMSCAVLEQWLIDGTVQAVTESIQEESKRRYALARSFLGESMRRPDHDGFHLWLPMTMREAVQFADAARSRGVIVTPPESTAADLQALSGGIRLCLGAPSPTDLTSALGAIAAVLAQTSQDLVPAFIV
ncbi:PLP-dependent aminotransferase family protein [Paraburkholderia sp. IW21]|uniref:aminotransferase-like domain-containing protein n=1 Tax=Paraburkholderia sp. IW21 TaxID=3242488 RepID=UPI00352284E5